MVYVPLDAVRRLMLSRWEKTRVKNPKAPRPREWEIRVEWYKMLEFYPLSSQDFFRFRSQFPFVDQVKITHNRYTGPSYRATEERTRRRRT